MIIERVCSLVCSVFSVLRQIYVKRVGSVLIIYAIAYNRNYNN